MNTGLLVCISLVAALVCSVNKMLAKPFLDCADVEIPTLADAASGLDLSGTWMQKNTDESLSSRCNLALETTWTPRIYFRMQWKIDHCSSCGNSPSARQFHICR
ncbi:hypothetical protein EV1_011114 [Malus domestica]